MSATAVPSQMLGAVSSETLGTQHATDDEKTMSAESAQSCTVRRCGGGGGEEEESVPTVSEEEECEEQRAEETEQLPQQLQPGPPPSTPCEPIAPGCEVDEEVPQQLQAGAPPPLSPPQPCEASPPAQACEASTEEEPRSTMPFAFEETFFIFDYDDTILPSTWLQQQGLRLDSGSQPTAEQRETLAQVAEAAGQTLRASRQHGTVVLVTNAERGWIELSCQKFLPMLAPMLENVKLVSARTTYDSAQCSAPLQWKLCAFAAEITKHFGFDVTHDPAMRKNILSLGDSPHEREALLVAAAPLPNCSAKSMKFVERPSVAQICEQHKLIFKSFEQVVHHGGNLDLCIRCP